MIRIELPTDERTIRQLQVGDEVSLFGPLVTGRDAAHKFMVENWPKFAKPLLKNSAIYHCGPVMRQRRGKWHVVSAGPTTSIREEPYEARVIAHYRPRIIIGKGGMGPKTLKAMKRYGAVYVHATGGAASLIASQIVDTTGVHMLDQFGIPEAFWEFTVEDFRGVVTMDCHNKSLHDEVAARSHEVLHHLIG